MIWLLLVLIITGLSYGVYLDIIVTERFEGRIWQLPARVYARPLEIYAGKKITVEQLKSELEWLNYTKIDQLPTQPGQYQHWNHTFEIVSRDFDFWDGHQPPRYIEITIENDFISNVTDFRDKTDVAVVRLTAHQTVGVLRALDVDEPIALEMDVASAKIDERVVTCAFGKHEPPA